MPKWIWSLATVLTTFGAVTLLSACSEQQPVDPTTDELTVGKAPSADAAWAELLSGHPIPKRAEGENHTAYLLRQAELTKQGLRKKGLEFWDAYPDDPRRYDWLQMTVHMRPSYPLDIDEWAEKELDPLVENDEPVNRDRNAAWETRYASLRAEFWAAPEVSDVDRRYLWIGEIVQTVAALENQRARGEEDLNTDALLHEIAAFYKAFPKPFNELDRENAGKILDTLWRIVFETHSDVLGVNILNAEVFLNEIEGAESAMSRKYEGRSRIDRMRAQLAGDDVVPSIYDEIPSFLADQAIPAELVKKKRAWENYDRTRMLRSVSPHSLTAKTVDGYYRLLDRRMDHEAGLRLKAHYPDRDYEWKWMKRISQNPKHYPVSLMDAAQVWHLAGGAVVTEIDEFAYQFWTKTYAENRMAFWTDPATTDNERKWLLGSEIGDFRDRIQALQPLGLAQPSIQQLMDSVHSLYVDFGDTDKVGRELSNLSRNGVARYGLDVDEIRTFLNRFAEFDEPDFQRILDTFERRAALYSEPFVLKAPTMAGDEFDIESLRGQIVLVDHWNTACGSCIEAMPRINETLEKYRDYGFEVVSLAYDGTRRRARVLRIKDELGLEDWISINAEPVKNEMYEQYDIWTFPQYMLLNRDGTLYAGTDEVDLGRNLPSLLDEMLAAENP